MGSASQQLPRRRPDKGSEDEAGESRCQGAYHAANERSPRPESRCAIFSCPYRSREYIEEQDESRDHGPADNHYQAVSLPARRKTVEEITRVDEKNAWNDRQGFADR